MTARERVQGLAFRMLQRSLQNAHDMASLVPMLHGISEETALEVLALWLENGVITPGGQLSAETQADGIIARTNALGGRG